MMKPGKLTFWLALVSLMIFTSACGIPQAPTAATLAATAANTQPAQPTSPAATDTPAPAATDTSAPTQPATTAPTETQPVQPQESPYTGFVVFKEALEEFQIVDFNGQVVERIAARGFQAWSRERVDVVGNNIYYFSEIDKKIFRSNASGLIVLPSQPLSEPFGFKISADETMIAWSIIDWNSQPIVSELWISGLDGSNATQVARITSDESPAFLFIPLEWTADGKLLFNRSPTGFGGYILYGGSNSLYSYDPASQALVTHVPAEELHGLCLDHYRLDLQQVAFNCSSSGPQDSGPQITLRSLADGSERPLATVDGYPLGGSVRFSPSGRWLAYAVAKGNPESEAGKLLVQPADLSAQATEITSVEPGFFFLQSWIDEDSLLVTRNEDMATSILFRIARDGSGAQDLAEGWFVSMAP